MGCQQEEAHAEALDDPQRGLPPSAYLAERIPQRLGLRAEMGVVAVQHRGALVTDQLGDLGVGGADGVSRERRRYDGRSRCSPVVVLAALLLSTTSRGQAPQRLPLPHRAPVWLANCFH
jgi:hypothetical protein